VKLVWQQRARAQILELFSYISHDSIAAAEAQVDAIESTLQLLEKFPYMGKQGRIAGTRELVISETPYIVAYTVLEDEVQILAVTHGAQRWPQGL
jgi:toxin ParE1/3/4